MRCLSAVLAFLLLVSPAQASPQSRALIGEGLDALRQERLSDALERFAAAQLADPDDSEAYFYQGAAFNRAGRFELAQQRLQRARELGSINPDLDFEAGWAALGAGRPAEAIRRLEVFEQVQPGRGKTAEFLGRAYYARGDYDTARRLLEEAIRRDPSLAPTARLQLAQVETARRDDKAAAAQLDRILRDAPETPLARTLQEQLQRALPPGTDKPWRFGASAGIGWNSNVIGLGRDQPLPPDISRESSWFSRLTGSVELDALAIPGEVVTLGYNVSWDNYFSVDNQDTVDHLVFAQWRHAFSPDLQGTLRGSFGHLAIDGSHVRTQVGLRGALAARVTPDIVLEGAYAYGNDNFDERFNGTAADSRDGSSHTVSLIGYVALPWDIQGRLGAYVSRINTQGDNFDAVVPAFTLGLGRALAWGINGELSYTRLFGLYENSDPRASPAFSERRRDDIDVLTAQLSRPVTDFAAIYGRLDYLDTGSNIAAFDFRQTVVSGGVVVRF